MGSPNWGFSVGDFSMKMSSILQNKNCDLIILKNLLLSLGLLSRSPDQLSPSDGVIVAIGKLFYM